MPTLAAPTAISAGFGTFPIPGSLTSDIVVTIHVTVIPTGFARPLIDVGGNVSRHGLRNVHFVYAHLRRVGGTGSADGESTPVEVLRPWRHVVHAFARGEVLDLHSRD